jgi:FkbH-like protein
LEHEHWFDLQQYTHDDVVRSTSYLGRAKAEALLVSAPDIPAYLTGLEMEGRLRIAREDDLVRIAQLEQKTNQFNLTTRRHSETALREFAHSGAAHLLVFGLRDRFTDHGLVSSLVLVEEGDTLRIDSWLMSCRVFARTVEQFIISELLDYARTLGAKQIAGEYVATEKNGVVANLYRSLGFERSSGNAELWRLDVGTARGRTPEHFIRRVEEPVGVSTG